MSTFEINKDCTYCAGTGLHPPFYSGGSQATCPKCGGTGKVEAGILDDIETAFSDLMDKVNDVLDKCNDILEAIQNP